MKEITFLGRTLSVKNYLLYKKFQKNEASFKPPAIHMKSDRWIDELILLHTYAISVKFAYFT